MKSDLLTQIQENMPSLSKSQRAIGQFIVEHYDKAAFMTASKLGAFVNVSESTVVRFAIELGYDGYPGLQQALRELIRTRLTSVQRIEITNDRIGESDILENVLTADIEKIKGTLDSISREDFNRAVEAVINAETIYIIGVRTSSSLAAFLGFNFNMIFKNVRLVQAAGGSEIFEQLLHIGARDVVIAISFPRYSARIINAVEYAKANGAHVVSLTDSRFSPIAQYADSLLTAKSDMASFVDSLVAPLSIINALIVAISKRKKTELETIFGRLETIWDEYEVYDKSHG